MKKQEPTILVVDDEEDIRQLVSEILQDEGYHVEMAENAAQAKAQKQAHNPALILLDIWMPDSDGISLLKEWVAEDPNLCPVVMMSGHACSASIESAVSSMIFGEHEVQNPYASWGLIVNGTFWHASCSFFRICRFHCESAVKTPID